MANTICAELTEGFNLACTRGLVKRYKQEAVIINKNDIDTTTSVVGNTAGASCEYTAQMVLKQSKKGVLVKLPETGNSIKGFVAKSKTEQGFVEYLHQVQILVAGVDKETKCKLDKLDNGRYVVALQLADGTVEIYGWQYGLTTGDYTFDIVEGGGGTLITLQSDEGSKESMLPLVYKPQSSGNASTDFDSLFENN